MRCDALQWVSRSAAYPVLTRASGKQTFGGGAGTSTGGARRGPEGRAVLENRRDTMKTVRAKCRPCRPVCPQFKDTKGFLETVLPSAAVRCRPRAVRPGPVRRR